MSSSSSPSSSSSSSSAPPPLWAVQLALQAILISVQHFSDAHLQWAAFSSNTLRGIPSFGIDLETGSAVQPTREQVETLRIPVQGEAWDGYQDDRGKNAEAVKGLRAFRTNVVREKEHLDKLATASTVSDPCPSSSNASFLCQLWQQVLRVALTRGPIVEVNASLPVPAEGHHPGAMSPSSRRQTPKTRGGGGSSSSNNNKTAKIDVIADGGKSWTRMLTIKKRSLLAEFREAESYMGSAEVSSDEEDVGGDIRSDLSGSGISEGRAKRLGNVQSLFAQLDSATANCSIVRSLEELLACRAASRDHEAITLEVIFTRIDLPAPDANHSLELSIEFLTSSSEEERYLRRMQSIANLIARLPKVTVKTKDGLLSVPSNQILPSALASGLHSHRLPSRYEDFDTSLLALPAIPTPPADNTLPVFSPTQDVVMDVSALVALVSDISHMQLPADNVELESLFHKMGVKSLDSLSQSQQIGVDHEGEPEAGHKDAKARYLHGRALAMQLALERKGLSFIGYVLQLSSQSGRSSLRFRTTPEAKDKFLEIVRLVAGPEEQRRARALLGEQSSGAEPPLLSQTFWEGSRWEHVAGASTAFTLPLIVASLEDSSSGAADPQLRAFTARCRQVILDGLSDLSNNTHSASTSLNPRQTAHTLNTLLMGIDGGMTTLTTNMLSVRWLVKEVAKRMAEGHIRGEKVTNGCFTNALIVVTHPRSLAEKMRIEPCKTTTVTNQQQHSFTASSAGTQEQHARLIAPQDFTSPISSSRDIMPSNNRSDTSCDTSSKEIDSKESPARGGETEHLGDLIPHQPATFFSHYSVGNADAQSALNRQDGPSASSRTRFGSALRWIAGPHPPAKHRIRHYPWWPFRRIEEGWLRLTRHVAWRNPDEDAATVQRELEARSEPYTWPRRPAWLRRGQSQNIDLEILSSSPSLQRSDAQRQHASYSTRDRSPPLHPASAWKMRFVKEWRNNNIHWLLLFVTCVAWLAGFIALASSAWYDASISGGESEASTEPSFYSCTSTYWLANTQCGLNGEDCQPFSVNTSIAFRCPANCAGTTLGAARAVGSEIPNWVPLVVGGGGELAMYRGDSWVCAAAIHAGIITNGAGGCGRMWVAGSYSGYQGSTSNGLNSESFDSSFPISYFFEQSTTSHHCTDTRERIYVLDIVLSAFTGLVLQPAAYVWFWILVCMSFWHVNFASEPRAFPPTVGGPAGDFLPMLFVCYATYRLTFRFLLPAFDRLPIERTLGGLALFWIGTMMNVVFADVPLQRLVLSDITGQPGALTSLVVIIIVVVIVAINQVRVVRQSGYLPKYLTLAVVGGVIIGLLAAIPTTGLRLHHYIIALVLLPFLAFETRISYLAAFFLLGMFVNGIGRWGFDGLIQDFGTIRGDSTRGSALPSFLPASNWSGVVDGVGLVQWTSIADALAEGQDITGYTGFSLIVDDVLRLSGTTQTSFDLASLLEDFSPSNPTNNATYYPGNVNETIANQPHYLRLAYTSDGDAADFTRAAVAYFNGTWIDPPEGAT